MQVFQGNRSMTDKPILLVDDDPVQLTTLVEILEDEGFSCVCCETGEEAITLCKKQRFSVGVVDLRLPDTAGIQVMRKLKRLDPKMKIIIRTGYSNSVSAMSAVYQGAYAFIIKSGDIENLLRHIRLAISSEYHP